MKTMIDLSKFTKDELIALNKLIIKRLKYLDNLDSIERITSFNIGDSVSFEYRGYYITGIVAKINIKTISIQTENNGIWRVSPSLVKRIVTTQ